MSIEEDLIAKKTYILLICLLAGIFLNAQSFQLANPRVIFDNQFFNITTNISSEFDFEGVELHYTLDGSEPTLKSREYTEPVIIIENATFKVKAFHPDFLESETITLEFVEISKQKHFSRVSLDAIPEAEYSADGFKTINDGRRGSGNFRDGSWLGFRGKSVALEVELKEEITQGHFYLGLLVDLGSWILGPTSIHLYGFSNTKREFVLLESNDCKKLVLGGNPEMSLKDISFVSKEAYKRFRVKLDNYQQVPEWHPGNADDVWIFIDEIILR